jgi:sulfate adenylyltransferase
MVENDGGFILVHVATPVEVCEQRDRKGLHTKAQTGKLPQLTGVSDPYESAADADVVIDTTATTAGEAAPEAILGLERGGHIGAKGAKAKARASAASS